MEDTVFNGYLNPMATKLVKLLLPVGVIQELLVGEYGLIAVALTYAIAIILPITVTFFIAFAVLEVSGYLPRLAIMSNRVFSLMGLNGKAVLPMVPGLFLMFTTLRPDWWLYLIPLLGQNLLINQVLKGEPVRALDLGVCVAVSIILGVAITVTTIRRYERERELFG